MKQAMLDILRKLFGQHFFSALLKFRRREVARRRHANTAAKTSGILAGHIARSFGNGSECWERREDYVAPRFQRLCCEGTVRLGAGIGHGKR